MMLFMGVRCHLAFSVHTNKNPPERPFYKASGGFSTTGVPGIEPGSGVLETLIKMIKNSHFTRVKEDLQRAAPTFVPSSFFDAV